ncbi:hypothetical protein ABZ016_23945 [Streptomyces sp. NPDC006372]|uniref:hypothetical protein n=1 Tax=Streptomyces sp. NPDC006372 TaxID=3155599 RepID=UPI0033BA7817
MDRPRRRRAHPTGGGCVVSNDVTITVSVRDLTGPGFRSVNHNINQMQRNANGSLGALRGLSVQLGGVSSAATDAGSSLGGGMGLRGQAIGAAAALGTSLLPTIGALAPMLTGVAAVGGGAALALGDLKKKAKELKAPFEDWKKAAEKAVAPHTERAVKSLKGAMADLTPVIETGADTFGRITEKAARFADSPAFKGALAKNAEMGSRWVEEFAGSVGTFTQAFLDFGTKSQPALDAWDSLLGGLLDTGLVGMFEGLEQGIGGASEMLGGFASFLNDSLLPSLGKISGAFAETFGPLLGEAFRGAGLALEGFASVFEGALEGVEPTMHILADVFRSFNEVGRIGFEVAGDLASVLGGALVESLLAVSGVDVSTLGEGFRGLSNWAQENEGAIRGAFVMVGQTIIDMVNTGVQWLPILSSGFTMMAQTAIESADLIISGLAMAFEHVPGIGDALTESNRKFDEWAAGASETLGTVNGKIGEFATTAGEKLGRAKLSLNVKEAEDNLASIKEKLEDPSLTKERRAKLTADKKAAEEALREARGELADFDKRKSEATLAADPKPFFGEATKVRGTKFGKKNVPVGANRSFFDAAVAAINGSVVGTAYINVQRRFAPSAADNRAASRFSANGNIFRAFADGGMEDHTAQIAPAGAWRVWAEPETGGEAYIPLSPAKRPRSREIAEETVGILGGAVKWFAKGGVTKSEAQARKDARGDLTISHFGVMAGHQRSEFRSALAKPGDARSLIDSLNQWATKIRAATHGTTEKNLLRALDSTGRKLLGYEKSLTKVTASLDKAKDKLDSLKQAAAQLSDSVKSGVLNSANITKRQGDGPVTVASVMGGLTASRDKATSFSKALASLQKKGLSGALLQQIGEAGVDGGGLETAGALLNASSSEIKSMNSLQSQIASAASAAGKTTSDAVYKNAIAAQDKLVKSLTSQQSKLAGAMDKLASAMEKAIEKGFGMRAAGGIVGAATGGLRSGWTMVGEHEPELVRLPFGSRVYSGPDTRRMQQQAWASMLNTPRSGGARYTPAPAGGGVQKVELVIRSGGSKLDDAIVEIIQKAVSTRGGDVQVALGQGRYRISNGNIVR